MICKAVLFDLDDTIFDRNIAIMEFAKYLYKHIKINIELDTFITETTRLDNNGYSKKPYVVDELNRIFDLSIDKEWYVDSITESMGRSASKQQEARKLFFELQKRELKTGIITNGSTKLQRQKLKNMNIEKMVDVIVISEEVGVEKPDKKIFDYALHEIDEKAEDCIFVGDNLENDVLASMKCGIFGILLDKNDVYKLAEVERINTINEVLNYI
jgi:putative hydrolase of the HAD superfamily